MPVPSEKTNDILDTAEETTVPQADADNNEVVQEENAVVEPTFQLRIKAPSGIESVLVYAGSHETVNDIKQTIIESPDTCAYSCFYLTFDGKRLNDFSELGDIDGLAYESELFIVEDVYTEREVRVHIQRLRDLLAGPHKQSVLALAIDEGLSFMTAVTGTIDEEIIDSKASPKEEVLNEPIKPPETAFTDYDTKACMSLQSLFPKTFERTPPQCIRSINLSGWNPPPHNLRLRGDILYLVIVTLENETLHITASTSGFFLSRSTNTQFDPNPRVENGTSSKKMHAHSLIHLLEMHSPLFSNNFGELQNFITSHQQLEIIPVNAYLAAWPWAVQLSKHACDPSRSSETYLTSGLNEQDLLRDWNEELQSNRELPRSNLQERVFRDRLINKTQVDFAEAARRGASSIVDGNLLPVNPLDPSDSQMYVQNNIFFSKGFDGRDTFKELGGDEAAHVATGKDLEGVRILNGIDPEGLFTLGSAVVDYKGVRIVAQSIVPGIFRRAGNADTIVYGSLESGGGPGKIVSDEQFHSLLKDVAKGLRLGEHTVIDKEGTKVKLYTSVETKGIKGDDGRRYLLDLYRLNPVDIEFLENECTPKDVNETSTVMPTYPHKMVLLRVELIELFWDSRFRAWVKEKALEIREQKEKEYAEKKKEENNDAANGDSKQNAAEDTTTGSSNTKNNVPENHAVDEATKETEIEKQKTLEEATANEVGNLEFDLLFNPDVFTGLSEEGIEEDDLVKLREQEGIVREASKFLKEVVIPSLIYDFASYNATPLDGAALTKVMHRAGVNMRYLGKIADFIGGLEGKKLQHILELSIQEMIVRASKRILRILLRDIPITQIGPCISHFFNCLLGTAFNANPSPVVTDGNSGQAWTELTPPSLVQQIREQVLLRFRYHLPESFPEQIKRLPMLREICLRVGIQIEANDYHFEPLIEPEEEVEDSKEQQSKKKKDKKKDLKNKKAKRVTTFVPEDILNLVPIVKQAIARNPIAEETFETGKLSLQQGQRQIGLELLMESLSLHEQTYGILHPQTALCYGTLAMVYYQDEERETAIDFQRRAVIAHERTNGIDNPDTIHAYLNLGLFEQAAGRSKLALRYIRHALEYFDIVYGQGHPDQATADNNVAVILQSLKDYSMSAKFFERTCETQEAVFGKDNVYTASAYHMLARAYTLLGDFKKAMNVEKVAYGIFSDKLGADDPRTKDAQVWLEQLTTNAVTLAKIAQKQKQQPKLSGRIASSSTSPTEPTPVPTGTKGHLPIDDLLKYIGETGGSNSSSKKGASGKKRQQKKK